MNEAIEPHFLTVKEASRIYGPSRSEIYRQLAAGTLRARKLGRSTLVEASTVRAFVEGLPTATFTPSAARKAA